MGPLTCNLMYKDPPGASHRPHAGGAASGASRGGLGATAAALTGAGSITATKRLLQVRLAPHLAHLPHDLLTLLSTGGRMRGDIVR